MPNAHGAPKPSSELPQSHQDLAMMNASGNVTTGASTTFMATKVTDLPMVPYERERHQGGETIRQREVREAREAKFRPAPANVPAGHELRRADEEQRREEAFAKAREPVVVEPEKSEKKRRTKAIRTPEQFPRHCALRHRDDVGCVETLDPSNVAGWYFLDELMSSEQPSIYCPIHAPHGRLVHEMGCRDDESSDQHDARMIAAGYPLDVVGQHNYIESIITTRKKPAEDFIPSLDEDDAPPFDTSDVDDDAPPPWE